MELRNKTIETLGKTIKATEQETLKSLNIPKEDWDEAKKWNFVRKIVNDKMSPLIKGRPSPEIGKKPPKGNQEYIKFISREPSPFRDMPLKNLKTDKQKYKHLKHLLEGREITQEIFNDLVSVLKL